MIGDKIKKARLGKGLSQQQLAKIISTSKQNISSYERNITLCPNDILIKLSEVLGVDFSFTGGKTDVIPRLTKEENRLIQECLDEYINTVSIIELDYIIRKKLDILEETNLNTFTLKELDILINHVIDDVFIDYGKPENRYLLKNENENFFNNIESKFNYWKNQILDSFPKEVKSNFESILNLNIEISTVNKKVYEYYYNPMDYEYRINPMLKLEDLNFSYFLGVEYLTYDDISNSFKISYEQELIGKNDNMILYSITNTDDQSRGYIAIEKVTKEYDIDYSLNNRIYDNDYKSFAYSRENIIRVLTVLDVKFKTASSTYNEFEVTRNLTEEEVIKFLNRAEDKNNTVNFIFHIVKIKP